eukprot:1291132-Karenia_brevis.AAC.1
MGSATPEIDRRTEAAWHAYYAYRRLWGSRAPLRFKRNVYQAVCLSVLISGLEPFALTQANVETLANAYYGQIRKILCGAACAKHEDVEIKTYRALPTSSCAQFLGLA